MTLLEKVCQCLARRHISYGIVGGYAVALHGAPRGTIDIDVIISFQEAAFIATEEALRSIGLRSRLPVTAREVFQFRQEYIERRNLVAWSFYNPQNPLELIDIIITDNVDDYTIVEKQLAAERIKVISKKDLIKMKKRSGRPQDLLDVAALEKL
jgi:hypothetical protein